VTGGGGGLQKNCPVDRGEGWRTVIWANGTKKKQKVLPASEQRGLPASHSNRKTGTVVGVSGKGEYTRDQEEREVKPSSLFVWKERGLRNRKKGGPLNQEAGRGVVLPRGEEYCFKLFWVEGRGQVETNRGKKGGNGSFLF